MALGPVQLLVIGFDDPQFTGKIRAELDRLRESDIVRLIDLLVVSKDEDGNVTRLQVSDLSDEEMEEFGATVGALIGFGAGGDEESMEAGAVVGATSTEDGHFLGGGDDTWYVDDSIPPGTAAAVALLEHRWAIPLRESIRDANGFLLADAWVHPADLVAVGLLAREEAATH
jgi:uncharacterized membrane protein